MRSTQCSVSLTMSSFFSHSLHVYLSITYKKLKSIYVSYISITTVVKVIMKHKSGPVFFRNFLYLTPCKLGVKLSVKATVESFEFVTTKCGLYVFLLIRRNAITWMRKFSVSVKKNLR